MCVVRKGLLQNTKAGGFWQWFFPLSLDAWGGAHLGMAKFCRAQLCTQEDGHIEVDLTVGIPSSRMKEVLDDMRKLRVLLKTQISLPASFNEESEDSSEWPLQFSL